MIFNVGCNAKRAGDFPSHYYKYPGNDFNYSCNSNPF